MMRWYGDQDGIDPDIELMSLSEKEDKSFWYRYRRMIKNSLYLSEFLVYLWRTCYGYCSNFRIFIAIYQYFQNEISNSLFSLFFTPMYLVLKIAVVSSDNNEWTNLFMNQFYFITLVRNIQYIKNMILIKIYKGNTQTNQSIWIDQDHWPSPTHRKRNSNDALFYVSRHSSTCSKYRTNYLAGGWVCGLLEADIFSFKLVSRTARIRTSNNGVTLQK